MAGGGHMGRRAEPARSGEGAGGEGGEAAPKKRHNLAVKVVRTGHEKMERVMWEVHVLRQLRESSHIVRLLDVINVVDACYMIMERVDGPDLLSWIHSQPGKVLPVATARRLFSQLLSALRHAHSIGFVHCDVKPENVRLSEPCDNAVLVDWGYARRIGKQADPITQGTPAYAAPEQLTGASADGVSSRRMLLPTVDVWGLGATLCEMLVGCPPFGGANFGELVQNVLTLRYVPALLSLSEVAPRTAIEGMLQIHPSDRLSINELCACQWVAAGGDLPADTSSELSISVCADCEPPDELGWTPASLLRRGLRSTRHHVCTPPLLRDHRLLTVVYTLLCGLALWWSQGQGSERFLTVDNAPGGRQELVPS